MKQLVYISKALEPFTDSSLKALTELANSKNKKSNITGCMLYASGCFIQLLEGEAKNVDSLYAKIEKDIRHKECKLLINKEVDENKRLYDIWFMTYFNVDINSNFPDELKQSIQSIINDPTAKIPIQRIFMEFKKYLVN